MQLASVKLNDIQEWTVSTVFGRWSRRLFPGLFERILGTNLEAVKGSCAE